MLEIGNRSSESPTRAWKAVQQSKQRDAGINRGIPQSKKQRETVGRAQCYTSGFTWGVSGEQTGSKPWGTYKRIRSCPRSGLMRKATLPSIPRAEVNQCHLVGVPRKVLLHLTDQEPRQWGEKHCGFEKLELAAMTDERLSVSGYDATY